MNNQVKTKIKPFYLDMIIGIHISYLQFLNRFYCKLAIFQGELEFYNDNTKIESHLCAFIS